MPSDHDARGRRALFCSVEHDVSRFRRIATLLAPLDPVAPVAALAAVEKLVEQAGVGPESAKAEAPVGAEGTKKLRELWFSFHFPVHFRPPTTAYGRNVPRPAAACTVPGPHGVGVCDPVEQKWPSGQSAHWPAAPSPSELE